MTSTKTTKAPADYMALVARFPLRPLSSQAEYNAAWKLVEPMVGRSDLTRGQQMYLDALSFFLEQYEQQHYPVKRPYNLTPIEFLKELMDLRGMTINDLARIIGSQPLASMILRGQRGISKANISKLAAHFRVDSSAFMDLAPIRTLTPPARYRRAAG